MSSYAGQSIAWFCLRSKIKQEHLAAAQLAREPGIEVYLPRIRFRRPTRQGPRWFTEALFPNYLFARFDLIAWLRKVKSARGVSGVVHFGDHWPTIPEAAINELRATVGSNQIHVISDNLEAGEIVQIAGGAFHGLQALVTRAIPGRERAAVLLDFLGRQTAVELSRNALIRETDARKLIL